ncbi:MAG: DUF1674 domain-containing protein [Alphaproteobacteria bacterium]|nr:DUF1674 domain-containing protein [Alphaproteobacteria bacterium]
MSDKKPTQETSKEENKTEKKKDDMPEEFGGTKGPEPTRYGDWENNGRCTDF